MKILALILAASTALAVPPIGPPTRTVPTTPESVCLRTFEMLCQIISERHRLGEFDDAMKRALIQWAYDEYRKCIAVPARLPYSERRGD